MIKRGKFLVLEGGVGSGKSTQFELLKKQFPKWKFYREPGSTPFGEKVRDAVQGLHNYNVNEIAAMFGYSAARANLIRGVIIPLLEKGKNIVLDRYWYSTFAYQGTEGVSRKVILTVSKIATNGLRPDLILFYDLKSEVGMNRKNGKKDADRYDIRELHFHRKVRNNYHKLGKMYPKIWRAINASKSIKDVFRDSQLLLKEYHFI